MAKHADLPFASTLCGSCSNVCPVKIDIHEQLYKWRQVLVQEGHVDKTKAIAMQAMAATLASPSLYRLAGKAARTTMKYVPFVVNNKYNAWYNKREMPEVPQSSFGEWYAKNRKN
jgi:L-lactate dehydrogenase complex protein LldF